MRLADAFSSTDSGTLTAIWSSKPSCLTVSCVISTPKYFSSSSCSPAVLCGGCSGVSDGPAVAGFASCIAPLVMNASNLSPLSPLSCSSLIMNTSPKYSFFGITLCLPANPLAFIGGRLPPPPPPDDGNPATTVLSLVHHNYG